MITVKGKKIVMNKGDYGLPIIFNLYGPLLQNGDVAKFIIGDIIEKEYELSENDGKFSFVFSLTESESAKLTDDYYTYSVKAYRNGEYLDTLRDDEDFELI